MGDSVADRLTSVILPTFNQDSRLALTLASLEHQRSAGHRWEVVVVDDGSTDDTAAVIERFERMLPLRAVRQRNAGRAAARNAGAEAARGGFLIFCDGDRICDPGFVADHAAASSVGGGDPPTVNVGEIREVYISDLEGRHQELANDIRTGCAWLRNRSRRPQFVAEIHRHLIGAGNAIRSPFAWLCFLSGNVSLRRDLFAKAGGFDEDFVEWGFEHFELGYRLVDAGAAFRYRPAAANYHIAHRRPPGFYEAGIAASADLLRRKHPGLPVDALVSVTTGRASLAVLARGEL